MADMIQMFGQVETGAINRRTDQVFYVALLRNHPG